VKKSVLFTPFIATPVLAGVARKTVFQIASAESIEFVEKNLSIDDVLQADEIFLTNVIMEIMPVVVVEKHAVGDGKVGPVAKKMKKSFDEAIEKQCRESK
jgi:branched-subunit amino acid aminotransferase/4-amino-4-deoxychorismate lyase